MKKFWSLLFVDKNIIFANLKDTLLILKLIIHITIKEFLVNISVW